MNKNQAGSIELIVLGLLAALIVVLAIPLLSAVGPNGSPSQLADHQMQDSNSSSVK